MKRDAIDYHMVKPQHEAIHIRLEDWAHWVRPETRTRTSPMFRLYRADHVWEPKQPRRSINTLDCQKIEREVAKLPEKHADALRWSYVVRCSPVRACRLIACTHHDLAKLVDDGRQMLVNRGV